MKREEINIRDPYVLLHEGNYYLYGTRSESTWGRAEAFDCYVSCDLEEFEGPFEIYHKPEDSPFDACYWAPECYAYMGRFYLLTTLGTLDGSRKKGIYVLQSDSPTGPFEMYSGRITPEDWTSIDGTLYFEDDIPYMVFSHSFEDPGSRNGDFCMMQLTKDLKAQEKHTEIIRLFSAAESPWARPVPFAEEEFGISEACYFSDGPAFMKINDKLHMIYSSWSSKGYALGTALSATGSIKGPWILNEKPLFAENGGHGMLFKGKDGKIYLSLHHPNDLYAERPVFIPMGSF